MHPIVTISPPGENNTPRMRRVRVGDLRPSHVPIAYHAANGATVGAIAARVKLSQHTIEAALRDIRTVLGVGRTIDIRLFHVELTERYDAIAGARSSEQDGPRVLTPGEVAKLLRVDAKTVARWAASGKLRSVKTPGGHRRFALDDVRALLAGLDDQEAGGQGAGQ